MKICNAFSGIGGNRKYWEGHKITAVEIDKKIAAEYKKNFPKDKIIVNDSFRYIEKNYSEFDFIWASPPCTTHSRTNYGLKRKKMPDLSLYSLIIFLKKFFKGFWVVENVVPYYDYLIAPNILIGRHAFWSNFHIKKIKTKSIDIPNCSMQTMKKEYGFDSYDIQAPYIKKRQILRNCIPPEIGDHILSCVSKNNLF